MKYYTHVLNAGSYVLKITSTNDWMNFLHQIFLANRVINTTMTGNKRLFVQPAMGTGTFKSTNEKVVKVSSKKGTYTDIIPVGAGKASVVFQNSIGKITYKVTVKKLVMNVKRVTTSCDIRELKPNRGVGTWKVANEKIASLSCKKGARVIVRAKNKGTTTITYENKLVMYKYKFTVKSGKTYPFDTAEFTVKSNRGIKPAVLISNNSDKTIKSVGFRIYFYNASNRKVYWHGKNYVDLKTKHSLKAWNYQWYKWSPVFYNSAVKKMRINQATITYTDGTKKTVNVNRYFYKSQYE